MCTYTLKTVKLLKQYGDYSNNMGSAIDIY